MRLDELFTLKALSIEGNQYGWVNTEIDVHPGMPLQIQGTGSINFCNFMGQQWWFTPDGEEGKASLPESLGYGVAGTRHAMLLGRINRTVFPVGDLLRFKVQERGTLFLAHNDTKVVSDNEGHWDVRICVPVQAVQGQRRPGTPAFDLQFTGPFGISAQASLNLPSWMTNPRPRFELHDGPAHGTNIERGLLCTQVEIAIVGPLKLRKCIHLQA